MTSKILTDAARREILAKALTQDKYPGYAKLVREGVQNTTLASALKAMSAAETRAWNLCVETVATRIAQRTLDYALMQAILRDIRALKRPEDE